MATGARGICGEDQRKNERIIFWCLLNADDDMSGIGHIFKGYCGNDSESSFRIYFHQGFFDKDHLYKL